MNKVAIYCRLSDEDKNKKSYMDDSESIQNQKNLLMKYALEKGWDIYKIYSDDDYSGLDVDRPEFNKMIRDAEMSKFNIILCKTQSRFTRDMELVEKYLHNKFLEWDIRFIAIIDGVDTLDKNNKKSRQINGLINEWYCEDISKSIKATFRMKQKAGKFIGSFSCYGYSKDPDDRNRLIIDKDAAEIVKIIFSLYIDGNGTQRIANILNEKNIPNPTKYKQLKGLRYKNSSLKNDCGLWNKTTIKRILKNQVYIGNMVQHKCKKINYKSKKIKTLQQREWIIVENTHEAIIDKGTFEIVQRRISSRIRSTLSGKAHLFSGKVRCLDCKSTMAKNCNGKGQNYLRCRKYLIDTKKRLCTSHSISLERLEKVILEKIIEYINLYCNINELAKKLSEDNDVANMSKRLNVQLGKLERDIIYRNEALKNSYIDKVSGVISKTQFNELSSLFSKEIDNLQLREKELKSRINDLSKKSFSSDYYKKLIEEYKCSPDFLRSIANELIDYIEIGEKNKENLEQYISIFWNF